jgi:3-oxoacyl-[acyl-carrier-protein] synthase-3
MPVTSTHAAMIKGITTCVPAQRFDNLKESTDFPKQDVEKVVRMAGVKTRHVAKASECSSDLCLAAAVDLLDSIAWDPSTVDAAIMVTQSPDYFLPSTVSLIHRDLSLRDDCAAFDVGLGCSGYPYGVWLASMMLQNQGFKRVLLLHGETPSRFAHHSDRAVALLFGDAGSATALEATGQPTDKRWWFSLHSDGSGCEDLIIPGGGFRDRFPENPQDNFVQMRGSSIFNFTIKRVPPLIDDTLQAAGLEKDDIDYFIFHQSNRFIMNHLTTKAGLPEDKVPLTIEEFGSTGGPSIPLTIACGDLDRPTDRNLRLLLLGYGVGLSWGSALVDLPPSAPLNQVTLAANKTILN